MNSNNEAKNEFHKNLFIDKDFFMPIQKRIGFLDNLSLVKLL
jgi:hypothetical protein